MQRANIATVAPIVVAALLAGCGGSSSSTSAASTSAQTSSTSAASTPAPGTAAMVVVTTKHNKKLGTILGAGPKQLTVYLFQADKGSASSCSGQCATVWPPVTTTGKPTAAGKAVPPDLGTITRSDGTTQVTYKGHPLYYYAKDVKDGDAGDTYGQGLKNFGADWYALAPSGHKVDKS